MQLKTALGRSLAVDITRAKSLYYIVLKVDNNS